MPLFLNNDDIEHLLTMKTCMDALEIVYRELGEGTAVAASRTDIHSPTSAAQSGEAPMAHYLKSMSGASPHVGTAAAVSLTVDEGVAAAAAPVEWTLAQGVGSVSIDLRDGARVALVVRCAECTVTNARFDADGDWSVVDEVDLGAGRSATRWSDEIGPGLQAGEIDAVVRIQAITTEVFVTELEPEGNRP